jgi:uncharacterized protein (DUF2236 family)
MVDLFIQQMVRQLVGGSGPPTAFLTPAGDPGLLGPDSMPWEVHADFMSMMIGGISSLVLQALPSRRPRWGLGPFEFSHRLAGSSWSHCFFYCRHYLWSDCNG